MRKLKRNDLLARQNAILAAHLALADLQKNLGPDQRITATAQRFDTDPYDDDDLTTDTTDGIDPVMQNWTGVWQARRDADGFRRNKLSNMAGFRIVRNRESDFHDDTGWADGQLFSGHFFGFSESSERR